MDMSMEEQQKRIIEYLQLLIDKVDEGIFQIIEMKFQTNPYPSDQGITCRTLIIKYYDYDATFRLVPKDLWEKS